MPWKLLIVLIDDKKVQKSSPPAVVFYAPFIIRTSQEGINLATFPEGTRSRSGRMMKFKAGAFKMAHKAGAPVFPISIINSDKVMPTGWMMAMRPAYGLAEVVVHPPISSDDKTEDELVEAVRQSMIEGLDDDQKPLR